jgi:methionyl-tRNA synthetase
MINRYYNGELPTPVTAPDDPAHPEDGELMALATAMPARVAAAMDAVAFLDALNPIWAIIGRANRYVEENAPWSLAKTDRERLGTVMYNLAEAIRFVAHGIWPFMPEVSESIVELLNCQLCFGADLEKAYTWGYLKPGTQISKPKILFPRIEVAK